MPLIHGGKLDVSQPSPRLRLHRADSGQETGLRGQVVSAGLYFHVWEEKGSQTLSGRPHSFPQT